MLDGGVHDHMRVITADTQELGSYHDRLKGKEKLECIRSHSHANHPSSSSLRLGAGNGAPGFSCVGSLTYPPSPKGFSDLNLDRIGVEEEEVEVVLTGISASRRDQPSELIESRNALEAMSGPGRRNLGRQREAATELHTTTGLSLMDCFPFR
jgi:hypothetical protein